MGNYNLPVAELSVIKTASFGKIVTLPNSGVLVIIEAA